MPISAYFKGKGESVMADMKERYGDKGGERIFHATANKNPAMKPKKGKAKMSLLMRKVMSNGRA